MSRKSAAVIRRQYTEPYTARKLPNVYGAVESAIGFVPSHAIAVVASAGVAALMTLVSHRRTLACIEAGTA